MCEICSKLTVKTREQFYDVVLVSLLLTLHRFYSFSWRFYCSLWTGKCWYSIIYLPQQTIKYLKLPYSYELLDLYTRTNIKYSTTPSNPMIKNATKKRKCNEAAITWHPTYKRKKFENYLEQHSVKCEKNIKTPNTDTFHAVKVPDIFPKNHFTCRLKTFYFIFSDSLLPVDTSVKCTF